MYSRRAKGTHLDPNEVDTLLRLGLWDEWEERAAIMEYEAKRPRVQAERMAFDCIVKRQLSLEAILNERG